MSQSLPSVPLIALAACGFLSACGTINGPTPHKGHAGSGKSASLPTPNPHEKVGNPYKIEGIQYVPQADPTYRAEGIASWYGPKFHGKLTANGELFDMNRLSAAHKTLPLPSLVRVTNLENGKSAVLRLNDRGPFSGDRIIDLSRKAAEELGTREQGLAQVRVEYLGRASLDDAIIALGAPENHAALKAPTAPRARPSLRVATASAPQPNIPSHTHQAAPVAAAPIQVVYASASTIADPVQQAAPHASYYVQVGAFGSVENARAAHDKLPELLPVRVDTSSPVTAQAVHHVRIGPYSHEFAAIEARKVAQSHGFADAHIVQADGAE